MDLSMSPEDEQFRKQVAQFFEQKLPANLKKNLKDGLSVPRDQMVPWHRALYEQGWAAPSWPPEHGGTGWTPTQKHIFNEEFARANAPRLQAFGITMVGPVIYTFGNDEQKAQHLPGILSGDVWWCQGYSEPGSGSDLASLRTSAVRDGDDYVVNGHKIWTTNAHMADWIFCLVRTNADGKPQEGISFLLIDMKTPGIDVKPIISIDDQHHLNEVFFTDVRVPATNRVGDENKGWTYAKFLLQNERTGIAGVPESKKKIERLRRMASKESDGDGAILADDPGFQRKLAEVEVKLTSLEYANLRILSDMAKGNDAGPASSILKIVGTEVQQRLTELAVEALAFYAAPSQKQQILGLTNEEMVGPDHALMPMADYMFLRASSIYGGSNEIQRNVIAKGVLGL